MAAPLTTISGETDAQRGAGDSAVVTQLGRDESQGAAHCAQPCMGAASPAIHVRILRVKRKSRWGELFYMTVNSKDGQTGSDVFIASSPGTQQCPVHLLVKYLLNKQINK